MVEKRDCTFCGNPIEPGTGLLFIKRDGTRFNFCSSKCRRNLLDLKRVPRTVKWTKHYIKGLGKAKSLQARQPMKAPRTAPKEAVAAPVAAAPGGGASESPAPKAEGGTPPAKKSGEAPKGK